MPHITPPKLSQERSRFSKDTIQPWTKKGGVNDKYLKAYGHDNHPDPDVRKHFNKKLGIKL